MMNIREMIAGKKVHFVCYKQKELWYETEDGFEFPVPISDTGMVNSYLKIKRCSSCDGFVNTWKKSKQQSKNNTQVVELVYTQR